jgi:hypothetical protein
VATVLRYKPGTVNCCTVDVMLTSEVRGTVVKELQISNILYNKFGEK